MFRSTRRHSFRPSVEVLESRTLLSVYTVDRLTDADTGTGPVGSLRYCLLEPLLPNGPDTINFSVTGTINLGSALPKLTRSVSIQGPGADLLTVRRDSGGNYRIFTVNAGLTASISGLTIANGSSNGSRGGGISNSGTLTISNSIITANIDGGISNSGTLTVGNSTITANGNGYGSGGGIYNGSGTVTVSNSTIAVNSAGDGAGICNGDGKLTINNCTISGNYPLSYVYSLGGGIYNSTGTLTISNSTITTNTASGQGGGIYNDIGKLRVSNCTISGNSAGSSGGGIWSPSGMVAGNTIIAGNKAPVGSDVYGNLGSLGHNLLSNPQDVSGLVATDLGHVVNPLLGPLQDNGGPTKTQALLPGSPAINAGDTSLAKDGQGSPLTTDQRDTGFSRIVNGTVDIGAYEVQGPPLVTIVAVTSSLNPSVYGQPVTFTATVTSSGSPVGMGTVTFQEGSTILTASVPLDSNGHASFQSATLTATGGPHTLAAQYNGTAGFAPSSVSISQTVNRAPLVVMASNAGKVYGSANPMLSGTITGIQNGDNITASFSTSASLTSAVGTYPIRGTLNDPNNRLGNYSVASIAGTLTVTPATTKTVLSSGTNPAASGQGVTFTVTVSAVSPGVGTPTGSVQFLDNGTLLGSANLSSGQGSFTTSTLAAGIRSITATYKADANFNPSSSPVLTQSVGTLNQRYVASLYLDLLGRTASDAEITSSAQFLDQGGSRLAVAQKLLASTEYRTPVVQSLYQRFLNRVADPASLSAGLNLLSSGGTVAQVKAMILGSDEYFQNRGHGTNDGFLEALYQDILGQSPNPQDKTTFNLLLAGGFTRTAVAAWLVNSVEAQVILVQGFYQQFLRRPADAQGLTLFVIQLQQGGHDEDVIAALVNSDEYLNRLR
jgi:hypothetical protein